MTPQDAFGRATDEEAPRRSGPPRWVLYMVAFDVLVAIVVVLVVVA